MRELKLRGRDADFCNEIVKEKFFDLFVGYDADGNEVFEGDTIVDGEGNEYKVSLAIKINYVPCSENLLNYRLKG